MKKELALRAMIFAVALSLGLFAGMVWTQEAIPQPQQPEAKAQPGASPQADSQALQKKWGTGEGNPLGFPPLHQGLRETEGCLGTVAATTSDGKRVIFGWFENKEAASRWYYSDMHQSVQDRFFPKRNRDRPAMAYIPDDIPIMALASFTLPAGPNEPWPQVSIELYTPLPGGLTYGGMFAPDQLEVDHMLVVPKKKEKPAQKPS